MSNPKKNVLIHVLVEPSVAEDLRAQSAESGAPVSEIIRRAIALRKSHAAAAAERRPFQSSFIPVGKEQR